MESMNDVVFKSLKVGDVVKGTVVSVNEKSLSLDLQSFTEGTMYLDHFTMDKSITDLRKVVHVGDEITCQVTNVDEYSEYPHILLSRLNQVKEEAFAKLTQNVTKDVMCKVLREVNAGYEVKVEGFTFFMPKSQAPKVCAKGDQFMVRILEIKEDKKSGVVSRKAIEQEEYQAKKQAEIDAINVDDVLTGVVSKVEPYGAYVKFNDVQGLLRLNQISHVFVKDINSVIKVGESVTVKVISKENGKLSLSKKALEKTPFELYASEHKVSDKVCGTLVAKLPVGMILEVAPNVRGLLHVSEYSHNPNDNFKASTVIGDKVEVAIIGIDLAKEKLSLSRKALLDNPWDRVEAKVGDVTTCKVTAIDAKGLTVDAFGVEGFIPTSDAMPEDKNGKLEDFYSEGDEVTAVVTDIKPREWFLKLSIRRHLKNVEREQFEKYMSNEETKDEGTNIGDLFKDVLKK